MNVDTTVRSRPRNTAACEACGMTFYIKKRGPSGGNWTRFADPSFCPKCGRRIGSGNQDGRGQV